MLTTVPLAACFATSSLVAKQWRHKSGPSARCKSSLSLFSNYIIIEEILAKGLLSLDDSGLSFIPECTQSASVENPLSVYMIPE